MLELHARVVARVVRGLTHEASPRYTVLLDTGEMLVDLPAADVRLAEGMGRAA